MSFITYRNTYSSNENYAITNISILWKDKRFDCIALWDTGATRTHVSQKVVDLLELSSIGEVKVHSHHNIGIVKEYDISLILPTDEFVFNIPVLCSDCIKIGDLDINVIIGMDIIRMGDFHIDYTKDKAIFTFRHQYDGDEDKIIKTNFF